MWWNALAPGCSLLFSGSIQPWVLWSLLPSAADIGTFVLLCMFFRAAHFCYVSKLRKKNCIYKVNISLWSWGVTGRMVLTCMVSLDDGTDKYTTVARTEAGLGVKLVETFQLRSLELRHCVWRCIKMAGNIHRKVVILQWVILQCLYKGLLK